MTTFDEAFPEGNTAEIELEGWDCNKCKKPLIFILAVENVRDIQWFAQCCGIRYIIAPEWGVYFTET